MIDLVFQAMADVEITNKQLNIAEKALIEKDKEIVRLKQALNQRDAKIKSLEESIEKWQSIVEQKNSDNKRLDQTVKNLNELFTEKVHERDKYISALKDIEGTLCAASDHFKELSNSIHKVLE